MDPLIILFGLGVGFLVGTTGMGGGSLMTPLLILVFGIQPLVAIGTDLAYAAVTKTVGGAKHWRQGTVDMPIALWLGVGSVPGALGGVVALEQIHAAYGKNFDEIVLVAIAGALLITGAAVLARVLFLPRWSERERHTIDPMDTRHKIGAILLGLAVGFVLAVTSAGSGALIAVGLILLFRLTPRRVVGTDVFHAAILLWVAGAAHFVSGNVDLALAGNILIGSIPGVWLGSHLSVRLPENGLRPALAIVLVAAGMGLLTKAGLDIPPVVFIVLPLVLAVIVFVVLRRRPSATPIPEIAAALGPDRATTEPARS